MDTSSTRNRNTVSALLNSGPYSKVNTYGAISISTTDARIVAVDVIRKALKVIAIASSLSRLDAFGKRTTMIEVENTLTIRARLTATAYNPSSAGLSRAAIRIWSMYWET
ncbi:hypothetical protein D1872_261880 [compost metagenome]